jgi:hypothetical protein
MAGLLLAVTIVGPSAAPAALELESAFAQMLRKTAPPPEHGLSVHQQRKSILHDDSWWTRLFGSPVTLGFGSLGREPIKEFLGHRCRQNGFVLLVEVGVWLGASVAEWIQANNCTHVIGVDPFVYPPKYTPEFNRGLAFEQAQSIIGMPAALSKAALVTGWAPNAVQQVHDARLPADVVYIDGGKMDDPVKHTEYLVRSLRAYSALYPHALVSGDDWEHHTTPMLQPTLIRWATNRTLTLGVAQGHTWFMAPAMSMSWACTDATSKDIVWHVRGRHLPKSCSGAQDAKGAVYF